VTPVQTVGHTTAFGKPVGWDEHTDGECGVLSVRTELHGEHKYHYSTWRPSTRELQLLVSGHCVELLCVGVQPPVSLGVAEEGE